jgi:hypothetical protein
MGGHVLDPLIEFPIGAMVVSRRFPLHWFCRIRQHPALKKYLNCVRIFCSATHGEQKVRTLCIMYDEFGSKFGSSAVDALTSG